ncbi:energy transducer TonB [Sulfurihydrogenibium sp.]|uniref:energy transducer TonB family protein n=1 Tax=Sulfurihydrogenibium sp. TaxID=2053621 RepID=UPI00262B06A8|nr:energy transducer TonB [Sulfurihydrogenibium sp.]
MILDDRKLLIIGFQVSLIIHIILFILLHFLPESVMNLNYDKPIEITVEEEKKEFLEKKVKIENKIKQQIKEKNESVKTLEKNTQKQNSVKNSETTTTTKKSASSSVEKNVSAKQSNPDVLKIDDDNLKLLNQVASTTSNVNEGGKVKNEDISFGVALSKIDASAEGNAFSRSVIYKPPPPKITTSETVPSVRVKIWINPDGNVSKVELLTTTGDPQINSMIISYMKRWKFNRINSNEVQWATLTVRFGG